MCILARTQKPSEFARIIWPPKKMKLEFTAKKGSMFSGVFHKPKTSELQPKIKRVRRNLRIKPTKNGRWYSAETQQTSFLVLHSLSHFKGEHSKMSRFQHTLLLQHIPLQECSNGVLKQQVVVQPFSWNWKKQQTYRHLYIYIDVSGLLVFASTFQNILNNTCPKHAQWLTISIFLRGWKSHSVNRNHHPIFTKQA